MQVRDILYERDGSVSEVAILDVDARVRFLVHAETSGTVSRSKLPRAGNRPSRPGTSRARDRTRSSGGYRSSPDVICASTSDATHRCRGETMVRAIWKPYIYTLCFVLLRLRTTGSTRHSRGRQQSFVQNRRCGRPSTAFHDWPRTSLGLDSLDSPFINGNKTYTSDCQL